MAVTLVWLGPMAVTCALLCVCGWDWAAWDGGQNRARSWVRSGIGRGPGLGLAFRNFGKHGVGAVGASAMCPERSARLSPS